MSDQKEQQGVDVSVNNQTDQSNAGGDAAKKQQIEKKIIGNYSFILFLFKKV